MSETTTDEMYDSYRRGQVWAIGTGDTAREKFDAWLAEVERSAAEKALTDAAGAILVSDWWAEDVTNSSGNTCEAVREWLRNRAAAYRREETE